MNSFGKKNPVIKIMAEEDPIEIDFSIVAAYHGQSALAMAATVFQAMRAAFAILTPDNAPARQDISIVSGHPGPGVRDAFEVVTRAVTRGVYVIDRSRPQARYITGRDISYSFLIAVGTKAADVALLPGVLPARFFELVVAEGRTAGQERELSELKRSIARKVLTEEPHRLFDIHEIEA